MLNFDRNELLKKALVIPESKLNRKYVKNFIDEYYAITLQPDENDLISFNEKIICFIPKRSCYEMIGEMTILVGVDRDRDSRLSCLVATGQSKDYDIQDIDTKHCGVYDMIPQDILDTISKLYNAKLSFNNIKSTTKKCNIYSDGIFIGKYDVKFPDFETEEDKLSFVKEMEAKEDVAVEAFIDSCKCPYVNNIHTLISDMNSYSSKTMIVSQYTIERIIDKGDKKLIPTMLDYHADWIDLCCRDVETNREESYIIDSKATVINVPKSIAGKCIGTKGCRAKYLHKMYGIKQLNVIE